MSGYKQNKSKYHDNRNGERANSKGENNSTSYSNKSSTKRNTKGSKGYAKEYGRPRKDTNSTVGHNDFKWWNLNPEATNYAGHLPFGLSAGSKMEWKSVESDKLNDPNVDEALNRMTRQGVMAFSYIPCYGSSNSRSSALNQAAERIFQYVRSKNSSYSPYDPADLMMYLMILDQAYSWYSFMLRATGLAALRDPLNRFMPRYIAEGCGVNYDSICADTVKLKQYITRFAAEISSFTYPTEFMIAERHVFMNAHVYKDSPQRKSQFFVFKPAGYYKYNETGNTGTKLEYFAFEEGYKLTVDEMMMIGDAIVSPLFGSSDIAIMKADILKAFEESELYMATAPQFESYVINPVYVEEMLTEIENIHSISGLEIPSQYTEDGVTNYPFTITQDPDIDGYIKVNTTVFSNNITKAKMFLYNPMLNFRKNDVTPEDVMLATRFVTTGTYEGTITINGEELHKINLNNVGTEVITTIELYGFSSENNNDYFPTHYPVYQYDQIDITSVSSYVIKIRNYMPLDRFAWKPNFWRDHYTTSTRLITYSMEEDNANTFTANVYEELNRVALYSALNIKNVGTKNIG